MRKSKDEGSITISCIADDQPACGFMVSLIDKYGRCVCEQCSNYNGQAKFLIERAGKYRIKVESFGNYNLRSSSRWRLLYCNEKYHQTFMFNSYNKIFGKLKITLSDKNYPEYKLRNGEYKLWLTF